MSQILPHLLASKTTRWLIVLLSFIPFVLVSQVRAGTTYNEQYYTPLQYSTVAPTLKVRCTNLSGCNPNTNCWNSERVGATDCGPACKGGDTWTKYESKGCWQTGIDPASGEEQCLSVFVETSELVCSTGDKCVAGEIGLRSGKCDCSYSPNAYKYCCTASGNPEACTTGGATQDASYPDEGQCPGGYIVDGSRVRGSNCVPIAPPPPACTPGTCDAATPACGTTTYGSDGCSSCSRQGPACEPTPTVCDPYSQGPICDTTYCSSDYSVCGQGHQYCLWDGSDYGPCSEEINNCASQCTTPGPDPGPSCGDGTCDG